MKRPNPGLGTNEIKSCGSESFSLCPECDGEHHSLQNEACFSCGANPPAVLRNMQIFHPRKVSSREQRLSLLNCIDHDFLSEMHSDVRNGLYASPKSIPCKYLYNDRGSMLFDEICCVPEYYPTRTELSIIDKYAQRIMNFFAEERGDLIEMGSGSDLKVRKFLQAVPVHNLEKIRYVPMDISESGLLQSAENLLASFDGLSIYGIIGDFIRSMEHLPRTRKLITFFGSSMGNFPDDQGIAFLRRLAQCMERHDRLLIGMDMLKPVAIMEAAYNDRSGVTAKFNLNVLHHINHKLSADFREEDFDHRAFFNPDAEQIEMHLCAQRNVSAYIADLRMRVSLGQGETIHTEISRKYSPEGIEKLFTQAGLHISNWYTDPKKWFSLVELQTLQV